MAVGWFRAPWSSATDDVQVKGYRLLQEVGSGGFSTAYAADDLAAGRRVALKVARSRSPEANAKFDAEAAIGQQLAAARGIVGTLDRTRTRDGRPVLVMAYYDQGTAADLLADGHRLAPADVVDLIQEVAQGLDAMHRQHYLHRDISPRNILRSSEIGFALGDLGCARAINSTTQPPWTQALTPGYAAPETVAGKAVQTIASDVYGLAATAWALFTGLPPYGRPPDPVALQLAARYELQRNSSPPSPTALLTAGLPEPAARVLVQALDPDPARRPGRLMDFSDALAAGLGARNSLVGRMHLSSEPNRGDADSVGPIQPPSIRAPSTGEPTELAGPAKPARPKRFARRAKRTGTTRRRWPVIVTVLACFVLSFTVVRLLSGPGSDPEKPTPTATIAPTTLQPGDSGGVAPTNLRITRIAGKRAALRWTPPADPDALLVLYRSTRPKYWEPDGFDLTGAKGRAEVPVKWSGGRYCFMLVVVVRASRGYTSNEACLDAATKA
jgi:serine/threonine protein kinase